MNCNSFILEVHRPLSRNGEFGSEEPWILPLDSYVIIELRVQEFLESVEPKSFVTGVSKVAVTET